MINFPVKSTQSGRETQKPNANRYFFLFSSSTELTFRKGLLLADRMFRPSDRFLANCSVRVRFFFGGGTLWIIIGYFHFAKNSGSWTSLNLKTLLDVRQVVDLVLFSYISLRSLPTAMPQTKQSSNPHNNKTMTDERQGKNKGIAISSFDADAEKQSRQAIDRKVLNSQKIISWGMNFNYLLPGGGKGSRIFGGDHMVFRGTRGGGSRR